MRIAIFAGTFDPITIGHLSVIDRAATIFDRLIVLIAKNPHKNPLFSLEERLLMINSVISQYSNVSSDVTNNSVVYYAREHGVGFLVRGVRSSSDVDYEIELVALNRILDPDIATVFIPAESEYLELSSTMLKELVSKGEDISEYCSPFVVECLFAKINQKLQPVEGLYTFS